MTTLSQRIAAFKNIKSKAHTQITELHRLSQKVPLLSGVERTYQPRDDEGDRLPSESQLVQINLDSLLTNAARAWRPMTDGQLAIDQANRHAVADVVVEGRTLLHQVPVTFLMFLEKQLNDWGTMVEKLPTLDPSQIWRQDPQAPLGIYMTDPVMTTKTKKVPRNHVKAPATDRHPAQVEVYHEDVVVGDWTTIRRSGALPAAIKAEMLRRLATLQTAVKYARESANQVDAPSATTLAVFDYLLGADE